MAKGIKFIHDEHGNELLPIWNSNSFLEHCAYQIRKGLMFRYWITLPWMWHKEKKMRRDLIAALNYIQEVK